MFVENSKTYSVFQGKKLDVAKEEIRLVFAIFLLSGYNIQDINHICWDSGPDTYHPVSNAISRSRFELILRFWDVSDSAALNVNDKFIHSTVVKKSKRKMDTILAQIS